MMHAVNDHRQKYWHPSWIEPDVNYRRVRIDHTKRALTLAKELGARSASQLSRAARSKGGRGRECLKLFVEMLKPVVAHAEKEEVLLLVEPEPDLLIETADQYLEFASKISSPYLGLNFDIGHSYCVKDDPADTDAPTVEAHQARPPRRHRPDAGASPPDSRAKARSTSAPCFRALKEVGYDGWVTIELYTCHENPDHAATVARERVVKIAEGVGVKF